jgi:WhiB family redox-sensing transcriptional regulator
VPVHGGRTAVRYDRSVDPAEIDLLMSPGDDLPTFGRRPAWHRKAACRGMGTAEFFPVLGGDGRAARAICGGCPVRDECGAVAITDPSLQGMWGGTSQATRQATRRAMRRESA